MRFYDFLEHFEKRPKMYLGRNAGNKTLNSFILGIQIGGNKNVFIDKKHRFPNFEQFTTWIGGRLNYKYENSSGNWSWFLEEEYRNDEIEFEKFFIFLNEFKLSKIQGSEIKVNKNKIRKIILYKFDSSKSLFSISIGNNGKIIEKDVDMTGEILIPKIEKEYNLKINPKEFCTKKINRKELIKLKII